MPEGGKVARRSRDGEGKDADKKQKTQRYKPCLSETSYRCAFVFYFAGLALSGAGAPALPKGEPLAKRFRSPKTLLRASGDNSRPCGMPKPLTLGEVARRSRDGEGKGAAKEPDTQRYKPCLSETSYRNAAGVISPGLPSQALARQLSQRESPWQGGQALVYASMPWSAGG